jgi:UDP-N-acetylglucosamine 2-epimerase (non-hydrolysing)/GDP/UDP-N,N'-diacetylbacillosamine 2-epimerase (hydrolysing)
MTRRVAVVTGTRAEYGLLKTVVEALYARPDVDVGLIVTGVHLKEEYGRTRDEVTADGFPVFGEVPMYQTLGGDFSGLPQALAAGVAGTDRALAESCVHVTVVLGDRLEALAGALAAYYRRIPLAHLHGGETSDYHLDDATRHAITRLAHLHFPATRASADRLRRHGEEPSRIHTCGAPGLDAIRRLEPPSRRRVLAHHGFADQLPLVLFLFHPESTRWQEAREHAETILKVLAERPLHVLALYPNGDPGSDGIIAALERQSSRAAVRRHLPRQEFLQALVTADVMIGNSSCGLIEASYTGTPVVHVGERNTGREHGENVLFAPIQEDAIRTALTRALSPDFKQQATRSPCPWGDGTAGERIATILAETPLTPDLLAKRLTS